MSSAAKWISREAEVEILGRLGREDKSNQRFSTPGFRVKLEDGSIENVERYDILQVEEQAMILELVEILKKTKNPGRSERYHIIMKYLLEQYIPFNGFMKAQLKRKEKLSEERQMQIDDFFSIMN
jgi:hypothetical protein